MQLIANAHKTSPAEGKMSMLPMLFISAAMLFQSTGERIWNVSKAFSGVPGASLVMLCVFILSSVFPLIC